jgi:hypothetical protein
MAVAAVAWAARSECGRGKAFGVRGRTAGGNAGGQIAKSLAEDHDMETVVRLAATAARDLLGAEAGSFALVDKETRSAGSASATHPRA